jgi:hypothetical protein
MGSRKGKKVVRRFLDRSGSPKWRFVVYGSNGRPMVTSKDFSRLTDCMACLEKVTVDSAGWPTEVQ